MVEQDLFLNMIGFSLRKTKVSVSFYKKEQQDFKNLQYSQLPFELTSSLEKNSKEKTESLYTDFQSHKNADYTIAIDLTRNKRFAVWYYRYQLKKVVGESDYLQRIGFVSDLDLWKKTSSYKPDGTTHYQVFSLRLQIGRMSQGPELVFMYNGISRVLNTSLFENEVFDDSEFVKFVYKNRIYASYNDLPEIARRNEAEVFPVVNKSMESIIPALKFHPTENKYPKIIRYLDDFKDEFLNLTFFQEVFLVEDSSWLKAPDKVIHSIHHTANNFLVGDGGKYPVFSPKMSLIEYGPVKIPKKAVRFFLIFIEGDNEYATQLYMSFRGLKKNTKNDQKPFEVDPGKKKLHDYIRIAFKLKRKKPLFLAETIALRSLIRNSIH